MMQWSVLRYLCGLLLALQLSACATGSNPKDPWELANRKVFAFNQTLDTWALRPVAVAYDTVTPLPVRTAVSNVFGNVDDVWIGINNMLQGKPLAGLSDWARFVVNSTLGIGGVFDIATELGLSKHDEDFGQTLAVWGLKDGPYVMLPFFGPRTLRDTGGFIVDSLAGPLGYIPRIAVRNTVRGLRIINDRADLLAAEKAFDDAALDRYSYLRDFYLNRRKSLIRDGRRVRDENEDTALLQRMRVTVAAWQDKDVQLGEQRLMFIELNRRMPQILAPVPMQSAVLDDHPETAS